MARLTLKQQYMKTAIISVIFVEYPGEHTVEVDLGIFCYQEYMFWMDLGIFHIICLQCSAPSNFFLLLAESPFDLFWNRGKQK